MKKTLSILLCLALMLSLGITAFATSVNDALMPAGPYKLVIHKYKMDDLTQAYPTSSTDDRTGEATDFGFVPGTAAPLNGVGFTSTQQTDATTGVACYCVHTDRDDG